ncbi:MAG: hypothetical protein MRY59_02610, partial [Aquisalinus sp.]|nr:hypothetical protein [Aquisalinus sp.]
NIAILAQRGFAMIRRRLAGMVAPFQKSSTTFIVNPRRVPKGSGQMAFSHRCKPLKVKYFLRPCAL